MDKLNASVNELDVNELDVSGKAKAKTQNRKLNNAKRRYHLALPEELYMEIELLAKENGTTIIELIRRFVKLGLIAAKLENEKDAAIIIRQGERERELAILL